jgi:hypothetical protein
MIQTPWHVHDAGLDLVNASASGDHRACPCTLTSQPFVQDFSGCLSHAVVRTILGGSFTWHPLFLYNGCLSHLLICVTALDHLTNVPIRCIWLRRDFSARVKAYALTTLSVGSRELCASLKSQLRKLNCGHPSIVSLDDAERFSMTRDAVHSGRCKRRYGE